MARPTIEPMPPVAPGVSLPWDAVVDDPVAALESARRLVGDEFVVDSGDDRYLFTFSAVGVRAFYALDEERASKGVADWRMLRRKLPDEVFAGRRVLPHALFGRDDVAAYLRNLVGALDATVDELGPEGTVDAFVLTRRLGHRLGLASWGGPGSAQGDAYETLVAALDVLDGSESFVHPDAMAAVAATDKAAERAALEDVVAVLGDAFDALATSPGDHALFARVADAWSDAPDADRRRGVALDVCLIHVASMSNLFAALGWLFVDLLEHPAEAARVAEGDRARAGQCALESTRMAQRSIMARHVLAPTVLDTASGPVTVAPGATIATLLPLTNTSAAPGLDVWDPDRWQRRRLADNAVLDAVELVTVFGHGRHTCPAQPFAVAAMTEAATRLLGAFACTPGWAVRPVPVPAQIGGVARAAGPCPIRYRRGDDLSAARGAGAPPGG